MAAETEEEKVTRVAMAMVIALQSQQVSREAAVQWAEEKDLTDFILDGYYNIIEAAKAVIDEVENVIPLLPP